MEPYLKKACSILPVLDRVIRERGDLPLPEYIHSIRPRIGTSYQPRDDVAEVIRRYAGPLLGETIAERAAVDFAACPLVLTANHHGIDSFAQDIQCNLIFSLEAFFGTSPKKTTLIFSFGNVSLNNLTYPQGLLLYQVNPGQFDAMPKKLPVFPGSCKRQTVSSSAPYTASMISNALARLDRMVRNKEIAPRLEAPLKEILRKNFLAEDVLDLPDYSAQSVVLNSRIWKRLFEDPGIAPEMVCLEIEKVVRHLLESDLLNPGSLARVVLFEPVVRSHVLSALDGLKGCWNRSNIERCFRDVFSGRQLKGPIPSGTVFFWGIDTSGERIPLDLSIQGPNRMVLRGSGRSRNLWELPFTPDAVLEGLKEGKLLPSMFTCFLTLAFARGVVCLGGYYQSEYLPKMQQAVVSALSRADTLKDVALEVSAIPADGYLSGMLAIMTEIENDFMVPAGLSEIIAGGGITRDDTDRIGALTVREAHLAALIETLPDVEPSKYSGPGWKKQVAWRCSKALQERVVRK